MSNSMLFVLEVEYEWNYKLCKNCCISQQVQNIPMEWKFGVLHDQQM